MNKDYQTTPEMKNLSDRYWRIKILFNSASDGDKASKDFIRENISVGQATELAKFVADCEAFGIHLVGRTKN